MTTDTTATDGPAPDDDVDETEAGGDPRRRMWLVALGLVATLIVGTLGFGAGVWLKRDDHPGNDSAEAGFARDMSTHHHQAVSMAMTLYRNGNDGELRTLAYDIALTQQAQIGIMDQWLHQWDLPETGNRPRMAWMSGGKHALTADGLMPGMATDEQMRQLRNSTGKAADVLFCQLMIAHHLGGIHMVEAILDQSDNSDVTELARGMKEAQQYEVSVLQAKLTALGG